MCVVIGAKCPYDEIPGIFKRGDPFSVEREVKKKYVNFVKPIHF